MAKRLVRYRRENGALVKIAETPVIENGKVDIGWLPVVGTAGAAVMERGSNANGEYTKFADGTMICCAQCVAQGVASGTSRNTDVILPATFAVAPNIYFTVVNAVDSTGVSVGYKASVFRWLSNGCWIEHTTAKCTLIQYSYVTNTSTDYVRVNICAVGRWK